MWYSTHMESYKKIDPADYLATLPESEREQIQDYIAYLLDRAKQDTRFMDALMLIQHEKRVECADRGDEEADRVTHDVYLFNSVIANA